MLALLPFVLVKKTAEEDPVLEDVLENKLPEPFSRENFRGYLVNQLAVENLDFCVSVMELKEKLSNVSEEDQDQDFVELHEVIVTKFVHTSAEAQINISGQLRQETLEKVKLSSKSKVWSGDIFDDALTEVKRLLAAEPFLEFVRKGKSQNLSKPMSRSKIWLGFRLIITGMLLTAIFIALAAFEEEFGAEILRNPFWRILSICLYVPGFVFMISGYFHMCPLMCRAKAYANDTCPLSHTYNETLAHKTKCTLKHSVEAEVARKSLENISSKILTLTALLSILLTAAGVVVPPSSFYD